MPTNMKNVKAKTQTNLRRKVSSESAVSSGPAAVPGTFDGYRAEGKIRARAGDLHQAISAFTKALDMRPLDSVCLVGRAQAYLATGQTREAQEDAQTVVDLDPTHDKALFMKGEALFAQGEFELATVCYHKAKALRPNNKSYQEAILRAEEAINSAIGQLANRRLELKGDLTFFRELTKRPETPEPIYRRSLVQDQPRPGSGARAGSGARDKKTCKRLLGELYGDKLYLEQLLSENAEILDTLEEEEKRREHEKRKATISHQVERSTGGEVDSGSRRPQSSRFVTDYRKGARALSTAIRDLTSRELRYLDTRSEFWQQKEPAHAQARKDKTRNQSALKKMPHIMQTLEDIDFEQSEGRYQASVRKGERLLEHVEKLSVFELKNKRDVMANIHSLLGNAHFELEDYARAEDHFTVDMETAEANPDNKECLSRALENMGRVYARTGQFDDAIRLWERRLPLCEETLEKTWCLHELGRCYLETDNTAKAVEFGQQCLQCAEEAEDGSWQLNACILIAQCHVHDQNYDDALQMFDRALQQARSDEDVKTESALLRAIEQATKKKEDDPTGGQDDEDKKEAAQDNEDTGETADNKEADEDEDTQEKDVDDNKEEDDSGAWEEAKEQEVAEEQEEKD